MGKVVKMTDVDEQPFLNVSYQRSLKMMNPHTSNPVDNILRDE